MDGAAVSYKLRALPLSPLISPLTGQRISISDAVQNIVLFVPFGVLGVAAAGRDRAGLRRAFTVTALGAGLSLGVEGFQLFTNDRVTSTSDLAANTFGALIGALAAVALRPAVSTAAARLARTRAFATPAFPPVATAIVVLCVAAWQPFDPALDVGLIVGKLRMLA